MVVYGKDNARFNHYSAIANNAVKATAGTVHRLVVTSSVNPLVTEGTVTLRDDTTVILIVPTGTSCPVIVPIGAYCATSIKVELSHADDEVSIFWT